MSTTFNDQTLTFKYTITSPTTVSVGAYNVNTISGIITIPSTVINNSTTYNVTVITAAGFVNTLNITSVNIPDSIIRIDTESFRGSRLQSINISDTSLLTSIGYMAFYNCRFLTSIYIPSNVNIINGIAFGECRAMTICTFSPNSAIQTISTQSFQNTKISSITLPDTLLSIGNYAFNNVSLINSTSIFSSNSMLNTISEGAFAGSNLKSIKIPKNVTNISKNAFAYCRQLSNVTFTNDSNLISFGDSSFYYCDLLTNITIPPLVQTFGVTVFYAMPNISVTFQGTSTTINSMNISSGTFPSNSTFTFTDPNVSATSILSSSQLKTNYPTQVSNATYVQVAPTSPTGLSFDSETKLLSWTASTGATSYTISYGTTDGSNYNLGPITTSSTSYTMNGLGPGNYYLVIKSNNLGGSSVNSAQISVNIKPNSPTGLSFDSATNTLSWTAVSGATYNVLYGPTVLNVNTPFLSNISNAYATINLVGINYYAVQIIQNSVTSAKSMYSTPITISPTSPTGLAFDSATNTLSWNAVSGATYNVLYGLTSDNVTTFFTNTSNINATLTVFGEKYYAVQTVQNGVTSANSVPLSVTIKYTLNNLIYTLTDSNSVSIAAYDKSVISGSVTIPSNIIINDITYSVTSIEANAFSGCIGLTNLVIPLSVNMIDENAFLGCIGLIKVIGPFGFIKFKVNMFSLSLFSLNDTPSITLTISNNIFDNCVSLTTIQIIEGVTDIGGDNLFSTIPTLTNIVIPSTVEVIGDNVFNSNINLNITFNGTAEQISNINVSPTTFSENVSFIFSQILDITVISPNSSLNTNFESLVSSADLGCFLKGSKVLTKNGMIPIQNLKKNDLVQTFNDSFLPIKFVGKCDLFNKLTEERINAHLYKLNKKDFPELKEDLYITGGHPLLMDEKDLDKETKNKLLDMAEMGTPIITEGKYRVFAMLHPKAELWNNEGMKEIYDIVLENDDPHRNYGIWVNGILTESMDEHFFLNYSKMTEINKD
jgi:hypothetical protein